MDIDSLEYYITVCRYRNVSKAAEKLHISQSALSRRMQSLEEEAGVPLIDRSTGKFMITGAGEIYLSAAEKIVKQRNQLARRMEGIRLEGVITVGFSQGLNLRTFIDLFDEIMRKNPNLKLRFKENSIRKNSESLLQGSLDIIYTPYGEVEGIPGISTYTAIENDLAVMVPRGHRLWSRSSVSPSELDGEKVCITDDNTVTTKITEMLKETYGAEIDEIECGNSSEAMMYSCISGYLALLGTVGNAERLFITDKARVIRMEMPHVPYGDNVFAWKTDNEAAGNVMDILLK